MQKQLRQSECLSDMTIKVAIKPLPIVRPTFYDRLYAQEITTDVQYIVSNATLFLWNILFFMEKVHVILSHVSTDNRTSSM